MTSSLLELLVAAKKTHQTMKQQTRLYKTKQDLRKRGVELVLSNSSSSLVITIVIFESTVESETLV